MNHDPDLAALIEADRRAGMTQLALPRRVLGRGTVTLLIALRLYVALAIPAVIYAFVHALRVSPS